MDITSIQMEKTHKRINSQTEGSRWLHRSWSLFGIPFAPLLLPLERRLQTLAALWFLTTTITLGLTTIIAMYLLLYTRVWWFSLLYFTFMVYDRNTCHRGGRKGFLVDCVRGWSLWKHLANYFPITLTKTAELDPTKNYLIGSHPHGIACSGFAVSTGSDSLGFKEIFPGMEPRLLTLTLFFNTPAHRELAYFLGLSASSRPNMDCLLSRPGGGVAVCLVVGGAREALLYNTTKGKITLNIRKGFIRIALRNGSDLVPSFSFGESTIYKNPPNPVGTNLRKIQDLILKFTGFPCVLIIGRGIFQYAFGLLPRRIPIHVVIGAPIPVEKINEPTQEDVDKLHARYLEALEKLFNEHKEKYGEAHLTLDINPKH